MARLLDPKVRNLMIFLVTRGGSVAAFLYFVLKYVKIFKGLIISLHG